MTGNKKSAILKIIASLILVLALGLLGFLYFLSSGSGQKWVSRRATQYLSQKLKTTVKSNFTYSFPDWIQSDSLLITDKQSDTLLAAKKIKIDLDILALLNNKILINKALLKDSYLNIYEKNNIPNYQFILDAFASNPTEKTTTNTPFQYFLNEIILEKSRIKFQSGGNTISLKINKLNTGFEVFDLVKSKFFLKKTELEGLTMKAIISSSSSDTTNKKSELRIKFPGIIGKNLNLDIQSGTRNLTTKNTNLNLSEGNISLATNLYELTEIELNSGNISYFDTKVPKNQNGEFDPNHLEITNSNFKVKKLKVNNFNDIYGEISNLSFKEKSGFELKKLATIINLKKDKLSLPKIEIITGSSNLNASLNAKLDTNHVEKSSFYLTEIKGNLAPGEALYFSKNLAKNGNFKKVANTTILIKGDLQGNTNGLKTENFRAFLPENTELSIAGNIKNFSNPTFDFNIKNLKSTKKDIDRYVPENQIPKDISIPNYFTATGHISGTTESITTNIILTSDQGTGKLTASLSDISKNPTYKGQLMVAGFEVGKLVKNATLGKVSGYIDFDGRGFDKPEVNLKGRIKDAFYDGKKYQNVDFAANMVNQKVQTTLNIDDENAKLGWKGVIDLTNPTISLSGKTSIESANLKALGLTNENIELKGDFIINDLLADSKNPRIDLAGKNVRVYKDDKLYPIGNLMILTQNTDKEKILVLNTDFMRLNLSGNFDYDQLGDIVLSEVNKYFKIPDYKPIDPKITYAVNVSGKVNYDPVFTAFLPGLKAFEPITVVAKISTENPLLPISGNINLQSIKYDSLNIKDLNFDFSGNGTALTFKANTAEILQNDFRIRNASLSGSLENNVADFALSVKDSVKKEIHALHGFVKSENNALRVSFDEEGTRLFYEPWSGNPYGYFEYSKAGIKFSDVIFTNAGSQIVRVSTLNDQFNGPLHVFAQNLDLNFFSRAIYRDSTLLGGTLNTDIELVNFMSDSLSFTGDYTVKNLIYQKNALGDLNGVAKSVSKNEIYLSTELSGPNNEVKIAGSFFPNDGQKIDIGLNLKKLDMAVVEPFMKDIFYSLKGEMEGDFKVKGSLDNPAISGVAIIKTLEGRMVQTGALLKISDQKFNLAERHLQLKDLIISDENNQKLTVNGDINLENLPDFEYKLSLAGKDFKLIDNKKGKNDLFYGTGYFDSDLTIKGKNNTFRLEGDVVLGKKTNLTLLIEDESEIGSEMLEIVEFVSSKKEKNTERKPEKTESKINFSNAVNINVEVPNEATLNILMDPLTGDLLTANGNGKFNIGFDNKGDLYILGQYDIIKGKYALTYQVFKKEFDINAASNSNIIWTGDPMAGIMDITAFYNVPGKKSPPFVNEDLQNKKLNIPVRVDLTLKGPVAGPEVNFEVVLRESDLGEYAKTAEGEGYKLINDKGEKITTASTSKKVEMNDRAVFLLVAGAFNSESLTKNAESIENYEDIARRKVSELISSSLNNFASGLIKGFDLNLGLESGVNTTNYSKNTNLSLGVSKKLANERLILSVGKNFELENKDMRSDEIFDNLQANWLISKDGRYRFNIFRKTQNDMVIEGSVIETGVGFIVAIDYETWKELFKRAK